MALFTAYAVTFQAQEKAPSGGGSDSLIDHIWSDAADALLTGPWMDSLVLR